MRFMGPGPSTIQDEKNHIERQVSIQYPKGIGLSAVTLQATDTLIGYCGLLHQEINGATELEITYLISRQHWGKGYGTEAARSVANFWRGHRVEHRLVALVHPNNAPSAAVAIKVGFSKVGMVQFKTFGVVSLYAQSKG